MASSVVDAAIRRALTPLKVRWYGVGAQAAILEGSRRLSADLDVRLDVGPPHLRPVLDAIERERIAMRVAVDGAFIAATRVLPMAHQPSGLPLDAVLAGPGFEDRQTRAPFSGT